MSLTSWMVCKAFLQNCPPQKAEALARLLPEADYEILRSLPQTFRDPSKGIETLEELLHKVHFSHFAPLLRLYSESEIRLFLSALAPEQAEGLKHQLRFSNHLASLTPIAKKYLQKILFERLTEGQQEELLPEECLPDSPLNRLLTLDIPHLEEVIHMWGLYDLSYEIKQIIETARLKRIYAVLTERQQQFLKQIARGKEGVVFKGLNLSRWSGNKEELQLLIFQRGINRLAKALSGEDSSLIWHITHRIDTENADLIAQLSTPLEQTHAKQILIDQIAKLLSLIQKKPGPL